MRQGPRTYEHGSCNRLIKASPPLHGASNGRVEPGAYQSDAPGPCFIAFSP